MEQKGVHMVEQEIGKFLRYLALRAMDESLIGKLKAIVDEYMIACENMPEPKTEKPLIMSKNGKRKPPFSAKKAGREPDPLDCVNNYKGCSKVMEAHAAL
eukprot:15319928-Ditylum_brightwellii.AAC.1